MPFAMNLFIDYWRESRKYRPVPLSTSLGQMSLAMGLGVGQDVLSRLLHTLLPPLH